MDCASFFIEIDKCICLICNGQVAVQKIYNIEMQYSLLAMVNFVKESILTAVQKYLFCLEILAYQEELCLTVLKVLLTTYKIL